MLTQKQRDILAKLPDFADKQKELIPEKDRKFHNRDFENLGYVRQWVQFALDHDGVEAHQSGVDGCLQNLRDVVKRWGWGLKSSD